MLLNYKDKRLQFLFRSAIYLILAQFATMLSGFVLTVILSRELDKPDFAMYKFLISLTPFFTFFTLPGVSTLLLKDSSKFNKINIKKYFFTRVLTFLLSLPLFLFVAMSIVYFFELHLNLFYYVLFAVALALSDIFFLYASYLKGKERFAEFAVYEIVGKILQTLLIVYLVYSNYSVDFITLAYALFLFVFRFLTYLYIFKTFSYPNDFILSKEKIYFTVELSLSFLLVAMLSNLDKWLTLKSFGQIALAEYLVASTIPLSVSALFVAASSVFFPFFAKKQLNSKIEFWVLFRRILFLSLSLYLISFLYILVSPLFLDFLFPDYQNLSFLSAVISLLIPVYMFNALSRHMLIAKESNTKVIQNTLFSAMLMLLSFYLLKGYINLYALPLSLGISLIAMSIIDFIIVYRKLR